MWTRAPPLTRDHSVVPSCCCCCCSCCCLVLDQEAEEGELSEAFSLRLHYNHQPGEQEQLEYYAASTTPRTLALREYYSLPFSPSHIHHDLPEAAGAFKRLPTEGFVPKKSSHMSTPESTRVLATRVRQPQPQLHVGSTKRTSHAWCMRCPATDERRRLDDMQTQIANAKHTLLNAASDQQVPELDDLVSSSKRRRVLVPQSNGFLQPSDHSLDQACEHHSQHMAKASTPEDIDSPAPASKPDQVARCSNTKPQEVEQESTHVEPLEQQQQQPPRRFSDDDTQSTSVQIIPSVPSRYPAKTMASHGSDEWLQLSLGSGVQSEETQPPEEEQQAADRPQSPVLADPQGSSVRDFFKFGSETGPSTTFTSSPITPRHRYSGTPEPRPFLEPRPRSSRDSPWVDPTARLPRGPSSGGEAGQFLLPGFSNLATLAYHPARVVQPVRSEQTETTSVHASPWMGMGMPQPPHHHHEAPNPAEFLSMATPGAFRDWRSGAGPSFLSMQPPLAQGVDADLAWRNLLQRVGSNLSVPSGFAGGAGAAASSSSSGRGEAMMLPPGEREEYMDALTRAVERFQGADQGGKDEPLTELQRLQRNAMFPPGQRPHLGPSFDPSTDISLARYFSTPSSSGSRPRAPAPAAAAAAASSDRQRRILRPHAPRPGLWFTLQASNSQPEASPLQQIPTAYIRVVDDNMTVAAVRRYLVTKLALASEDEVELTCKGQLLQPSISLSQVRDGIWQSPNTNTPNPSTSQLLSEGKAWKAPDGSITLVGDVVMVLTYGRRPPAPPPTSA